MLLCLSPSSVSSPDLRSAGFLLNSSFYAGRGLDCAAMLSEMATIVLASEFCQS